MRTTRLALLVALLAALVAVAPAAALDPAGPQIEIASPQDGWGFYQGQRVQAAYGCFAGTFEWPVIACDGDLPLGELLDTNRVGEHTFTVHAVDWSGAEATLTHSYTVFDTNPPTATIATPAANAEYPVGAELYASYSCDDGPGGSPIAGCIGTYPAAYRLPTDRVGTFAFTVDAFDTALNHGSTTVTYRVVDRTPPQIAIVAPADGAEYHVGDTVTPSFTCRDDVDGFHVSCRATPVDTSPGTHTFRVDSFDSSGNASFATTTYAVRYEFSGFFSPLVAEPSSAALRAGDAVPAKFSLDGDRGADAVTRTAWRPCGVATNDSSTAFGALTYSGSSDRYTFKWATDRAWAGTCKELLLTLRDGTTHGARVSFR